MSVAVDLSRLDNDIVKNALPIVHFVGKEVDLLETIRRTDNKENLTFNLIEWQAYPLNISKLELNKLSKVAFIDNKMIDVDEDDKVEILYESTDEVYDYGIQRMEELCSENELKLIHYLVNTNKKPVHKNELEEIIDLFERPYRSPLITFLFGNNILTEFEHKSDMFCISPRIYKDEKKFKVAFEILEDEGLSLITNFLKENPGNPQSVVQRHLSADPQLIDLLSKSGLIDPIKLDVVGDAKSYLFSPDTALNRKDKDHFDLVKMTLANFRFGEYYSKKYNLTDLDAFLSSMINRGFAGKATPIGTDYKNLEAKGIVRVERVSGTIYRFWMLKKDVIEDARAIVRGIIPVKSEYDVKSVELIESLVKTRSAIKPDTRAFSLDKVVKVLRQIEEGIL